MTSLFTRMNLNFSRRNIDTIIHHSFKRFYHLQITIVINILDQRRRCRCHTQFLNTTIHLRNVIHISFCIFISIWNVTSFSFDFSQRDLFKRTSRVCECNKKRVLIEVFVDRNLDVIAVKVVCEYNIALCYEDIVDSRIEKIIAVLADELIDDDVKVNFCI